MTHITVCWSKYWDDAFPAGAVLSNHLSLFSHKNNPDLRALDNWFIRVFIRLLLTCITAQNGKIRQFEPNKTCSASYVNVLRCTRTSHVWKFLHCCHKSTCDLQVCKCLPSGSTYKPNDPLYTEWKLPWKFKTVHLQCLHKQLSAAHCIIIHPTNK